MQWIRQNRDVVSIVLIGFVLRISFVGVLHTAGYTSDEKEYISLATKLADGGAFIDSNNELSTKAPLWPFVLSLIFGVFGRGLFAPHLLNCFLGALTIYLGFKLCWELTEERFTALIAAALLALYPGLVVYSDVLQTETVYIVFVLLAFLFLERLRSKPDLRYAILLGVCAAIATLTRAIYFGFFILMIVLAGWMWRQRIRMYWPKLWIAMVVWAALLTPWTVRNFNVHHAFVPISTWGGISLLLGNNPYSTGTWSTKPGFESWFAAKAAEDGIDFAGSTEVQRSNLGRKLALEFITTHPVDAIKLSVKKFYMHWVYPITNSDSNTILQAICVAGDVVLYALAGIGVLAVAHRERFLGIVTAIVFFTLLQVVMHCEARYRLPIMPLIAIFSAIGAAMVWDTSRMRLFFHIPRNRMIVTSWLVFLGAVYSFTLFQSYSGNI